MQDITLDNIRQIKQLPPPSGVSQEIIRVIANEPVDLTDLINIINKSPAITARILRCANSAYFGQRTQIVTVREAIIRVLGLKLTSSLSLAMALSEAFNIKKCVSFDAKRYWFTAIATAISAQEITYFIKLPNKPDPATAYTAGLIHNIGLQALVHLFPELMSTTFLREKGSLSQRLQTSLGIDHHQAAVMLGKSWNLPIDITKTFANSEDNSDADDPLVQIVWLSAEIANTLYQGKLCEGNYVHFSEQLISADNLHKVIAQIDAQAEELHELSQLITRARA